MVKKRKTTKKRAPTPEESPPRSAIDELRAVSRRALLPAYDTADAQRAGGRASRISLRLHPDLRDFLVYLADRENRNLSQYVETLLINHARKKLSEIEDPDDPAREDLMRFLGWSRDKMRRWEKDRHPFARELYARAFRGTDQGDD